MLCFHSFDMSRKFLQSIEFSFSILSRFRIVNASNKYKVHYIKCGKFISTSTCREEDEPWLIRLIKLCYILWKIVTQNNIHVPHVPQWSISWRWLSSFSPSSSRKFLRDSWSISASASGDFELNLEQEDWHIEYQAPPERECQDLIPLSQIKVYKSVQVFRSADFSKPLIISAPSSDLSFESQNWVAHQGIEINFCHIDNQLGKFAKPKTTHFIRDRHVFCTWNLDMDTKPNRVLKNRLWKFKERWPAGKADSKGMIGRKGCVCSKHDAYSQKDP